jgi:ATP-dependent metalloprotease
MNRMSVSSLVTKNVRAVVSSTQGPRLQSFTLRTMPVAGYSAAYAPAAFFTARRCFATSGVNAAAAAAFAGNPAAGTAARGSKKSKQHQQAADAAATSQIPPSMQHPLAMLGTLERPLVITSPPAPKTMASRLWLFVIAVIGMSAALQLYDAYDQRNAAASAASNGGASGTGQQPGGGATFASKFGIQEVKPVDLEATTVSFADIQGVDEAKEELADIVSFLKDPAKFNEMGARLPKGALLVGPPGGGKTMLAKAIAKEAGVAFFYCSGSEFDEMFVGVGSRRVRELFKAAKAHSPALIFIDEIDALGGKRSGKDQSQSRSTLNQLLTEMDGFLGSDSVVVLAATNTPESLDKALMRPGRFDTTVSIDPPDVHGREAIIGSYLKKVRADASVIAHDIARGTAGMTGAELSNLINLAAIRAVVTGKPSISAHEIDYAKDRVLMGAENKTKAIPEAEKRVTAFHEGGHALVAMLLEKDGADPVHKATIVPRGSGILGLVQQQPKEDRYSQSRKQMLARLQVCLAGRIAEEILLGDDDVTSGAASDFQQATAMARAMVRRYGFGGNGLGTVDYGSADSAEGAYMSDATKEKIEVEVRRLITTSYDDAKKTLTRHRDKLDMIATNLLEHETLSGDQLRAIVDGKPMPANSFAPPPSRAAQRVPRGNGPAGRDDAAEPATV